MLLPRLRPRLRAIAAALSGSARPGLASRLRSARAVAWGPGRPAAAILPALAAVLGLSAIAVAGCTSAPVAPASPEASPAISAFPVGERADYQLGGGYTPPAGVGIVARDSTEKPADGAWSVCYVNGFQTQPGEQQRWSGDLLLTGPDGAAIIDPAWPDEFVLDTRTPARREAITAIIGNDIQRCATSGFDAVEIDNLDSFTRFEALTSEGNLALARLYAEQAHHLGLAIGQKNAAEFTRELHEDVGFDFAVTEECVSFRECHLYSEVYGDAMIDIEYSDDPAVTYESVCAETGRPTATVFRDRDLAPAGAPGYVFRLCE